MSVGNATDTHRATSLASAWRFADRYAAALYLAAVLAVFAVVAPGAFTIGSATTAIQLSIPLIVISIGMTFCLVCGEVDLSVAGVAGLASTVTALLLAEGLGWPLVLLVALLLGSAVGVFNGLFTALLVPSFPKFPSFLVTLATLAATTGFAQSIQPLEQAVAIDDPGFQSMFGSGRTILGSPALWYAVVVAVIAHVVLARSRLGYAAYAVGTSMRASEFVGHSAVRMKFGVMVISGLCAAFGGVLMAGFVQAGFSTIAEGVEIDAIAAAVIGGAALSGGRGSVVGTVWGVLILGVLNTGLLIVQVTSNWQFIIKGGLVILALAIGEHLRLQASRTRGGSGP